MTNTLLYINEDAYKRSKRSGYVQTKGKYEELLELWDFIDFYVRSLILYIHNTMLFLDPEKLYYFVHGYKKRNL